MGICACGLCVVVADQAVQDVEGVEEEVRVYLVLQLYISVLGHIRLFAFLLHLAPCRKGVVYYVYDAVDGNLCEKGCDVKQRESVIEDITQSYRNAGSGQDAFKEGGSEGECKKRQQAGCLAPLLRVASCIAHIEDIYADQGDQ